MNSLQIGDLIEKGWKDRFVTKYTGKQAVISFLQRCCEDKFLLKEFEIKNCLELIFHLKTIGYFTTENDWRLVIGPMEYYVVTVKENEEFGPNSSLWGRMYGKTFLRYIVEVFKSLDQEEIKELFFQ